MKKIALFIAIALFTTIQSYSQCACCAGAGAGSSNGYYNNGIFTLSKKQWVVEGYSDYRTIKDGGAMEEDEKLLKSMSINSLGVRYGITDKITVTALLPYVFLHTNSGNDNGLGDLNLIGTFNVYSKNNFNAAFQAGIKLPTGIQKNSNFDNTTVVVGSGSYDPIAGVLLSKNWEKFTLVANGLFKYATSGFNNNYYGSVAIHNLSLSYNITGNNGSCSIDSIESKAPTIGLSVFGGYYGEWLDKLKEDNVVDENSGYYLGFLTLGTNISYEKWNFPLIFSSPVINHVNGDQNDAGFRVRFGVVRSF